MRTLRIGLLPGAVVFAAACGGGQQPGPVAEPMAPPAAAAPRPTRAISPADVPPRRAVDAAPAQAPTPAGPPLFQRLGGLPAITAVVDSFTARVAADERINAFFRGVDIPNFKRLLVEQVCQATGGPCAYTGRDMRTAHRGLELTDAHFDALVEDLQATLVRFSVPPREQAELLAALAGMRRDIVGQ